MNNILLVSCPDRKGLVFAVTQTILSLGGNIINLEQHVDHEEKQFFMRVEWEGQADNLLESFSDIIKKFEMKYDFFQKEKKIKMAIFVSKLNHCIVDTLIRVESGQLPVDVPLIVSNYPDMKITAGRYGIPYYHFPIDNSNKEKQEQRILNLMDKFKVDFIALARYMKILGKEIVSTYKNRIINVHHSFLPAFEGAKPYHRAYERGVKIIGATSHFVDEDLDKGPIIEQAVRRTGHHFSISELVDIGKEIEKEVFFTALKKYLERKIIVYKNRTIIFH